MQKLTFTINMLFASAILLSTSNNIHGMEKLTGPCYFIRDSPDKVPNKREKQEQKKLIAKGYNTVLCPLTRLSDQILITILETCPINWVLQNIRQLLALRATCTRLHTILDLETMGNICKHYTHQEKEQALKGLFRFSSPRNYKQNRFEIFILLYAGANPNIKISHYPQDIITKYFFVHITSLLEYARYYNDTELMEILTQMH